MTWIFSRLTLLRALLSAVVCSTLASADNAANPLAADTQARSPWSPAEPMDKAIVAAAVTSALGPLSEQFQATSFRGTTLGQAHDISKGTFNPGLLRSTEYPVSSGENVTPRRLAFDIALVERESRKVVGIVALYMPGTLDDMADDVVSVFGKTPNKIETVRGSAGTQLTTLKYLFPASVVRVVGARFPGTVVPQVKITIIDREFAEQSLRGYGTSVLTACNWIESNMARMKQAQPDITTVTALADTTGDYDADAGVACFFDPLAKTHRFGEAGAWPRPDVIDVAGCYITKEKIGFICDPLVSESINMPRLCSHEFSNEREGISSSLGSTSASDLVLMTASYILQHKFPPEGTTIDIVSSGQSPEAHASSRLHMGFNTDKDSSPLDRMQYLQFRAFCDRHEWTDKEGNLVQVGSNGSFSVVRKRPGSAQGL